MAGLGIALISEHTVMAELAQKRLVALKFSDLPIIRKWILVHPKDAHMSAAAMSFQKFLLENREKFIPKHR
jgi:DNA-binding transcriptional LysR family regulator